MQPRSTLVALALASFAVPALAGDATIVAPLDGAELPALARRLPVGSTLRLEGVALGDAKGAGAFELERFEVFAPDARVVVHGDGGEEVLRPPDNVYLRGSIVGEPRSSVVLTVLAAGGMRGLATSGGEYWVMSAEAKGLGAAAGLQLRRIDAETELAEESGRFSCESDELGAAEVGPAASGEAFGGADLLAEVAAARNLAASAAAKAGPGYTARVAVETDYELMQRLGGVQAAADYIGDVFAHLSGIYSAEIDTALLLSHLSLWTTSADPWTQTSSRCGFYEFGKFWNDNREGVDRTIAHFMSGKSTGGGIAWVGVLCTGAFNIFGVSAYCPDLPDLGNYGGAYGFSGSIYGSFDPENPSVVWDVLAVGHEIGHNFNSPHSHCYGGIGGSSSPVDQCYGGQSGTGCYVGSPSLPCSQPGGGCGTIMSYCHLLNGGLGNISMTFGDGHPFGTQPERVPNHMYDHVVTRASFYPSCLQSRSASQMIFTDGFESGNMSSWN